MTKRTRTRSVAAVILMVSRRDARGSVITTSIEILDEVRRVVGENAQTPTSLDPLVRHGEGISTNVPIRRFMILVNPQRVIRSR
ncbi:MAG: hypothetical protein HKL85_12215 [Acidimicrobiaceae bacterium]|jgi:hypothetical protein|nr:hypothetical protein [Acidimicrobiaceae bacterium]